MINEAGSWDLIGLFCPAAYCDYPGTLKQLKKPFFRQHSVSSYFQFPYCVDLYLTEQAATAQTAKF